MCGREGEGCLLLIVKVLLSSELLSASPVTARRRVFLFCGEVRFLKSYLFKTSACISAAAFLAYNCNTSQGKGLLSIKMFLSMLHCFGLMNLQTKQICRNLNTGMHAITLFTTIRLTSLWQFLVISSATTVPIRHFVILKEAFQHDFQRSFT